MNTHRADNAELFELNFTCQILFRLKTTVGSDESFDIFEYWDDHIIITFSNHSMKIIHLDNYFTIM